MGLLTGLDYYHFLRREGYKHRTAVYCTLMRSASSAEDLYRRLRRYSF